ncbi:MAG: aldo/keto reductase [Lachnospiraceae bacterium]|nr:aldo/keto reductase [Lachnospiraceae bacterium]
MIPELILNNQQKMPFAGLGIYKINNESDMSDAVNDAVDLGYRMFDTASVYRNEEIFGKAVRSCGLSRGELFITSKVWNTAQRMGDIEGAFNRSLDRMKLDYIDLYLIHWPVPGCYGETWKHLEQIYHSGRARSIGVSNFGIVHLEHLFEMSGIVPAVNQIECHPLWNQHELTAYCQERGITVQAYAPLARGAYVEREILRQIGNKYQKTATQIGLRWLVQQNISVVPKSINLDHLEKNVDIFDFTLTDTEMATISTMDEHLRTANIPEDMINADLQ